MATPSDEAKLAELTPDTRDRVEALMRAAAERDMPVAIVEAYRDLSRQAHLVIHGKSQTHRSWHRTGRAVDLIFVGRGGRTYEGPWLALGELGEALGLEWGGRWVTLNDRTHFQFRGAPPLSFEDALAQYRAQRPAVGIP